VLEYNEYRYFWEAATYGGRGHYSTACKMFWDIIKMEVKEN
jgi:hypothetical protein